MSNDFQTDVAWSKNRLDIKLSAYSPTRAALMVIRPAEPQKHVRTGQWLVYFDRNEQGAWGPEPAQDGIRVYDLWNNRSFRLMEEAPPEVLGIIIDAVEQLSINDEAMVDKGRARASLRLKEHVSEGRASIEKARITLSQHRRNMSDYASRQGLDPSTIVPDTSTAPVPDDVIDTEFGPLILRIQGLESFSLETPGRVALLDREGVSRPVLVEWTGQKWKHSHPDAPRIMAMLEKLKDDILVGRREDFRKVAIAHVAQQFADVDLKLAALDRYEELLERHEAEGVAELDAEASTTTFKGP